MTTFLAIAFAITFTFAVRCWFQKRKLMVYIVEALEYLEQARVAVEATQEMSANALVVTEALKEIIAEAEAEANSES